ncbi:MAG: iron permease FTR1, high-affinity iron transporter [Candidatus Gottesmanbacteria bacterium GW2011_GWA2_43_14]|uniref:Iron permease FTR1, high-affinity iron transporter n=1 Tax=Candidatus Gottesmanbacteria bacterium GW2011_GWA2_43_14 TaxID=1618443 RepID=A0A0G1FRH2_9BACT|nr:MAG: iron permease FTR1, high-affinity iron transporter [Candidatus Gottesmanbacteria bacterium GW2011_GWA2_43_14]
MIPSFLITFREVIEASLIVATILGILAKLGDKKGIRTVWLATGAATTTSLLLLLLGSLFGLSMQKLYSGRTEEVIEGSLMVISAVFITWAVFFLHNYFGKYKTKLIQKIKKTVENQEHRGLFILAFTAVFREGFEIVLFLSTIFFSVSPQNIFTGFAAGFVLALLVSLGLFTATLRLPVFYAFRMTSILLILFAAGLLARGVHEFAEAGFVPEIGRMTIHFLPEKVTFVSDMVKAVFGLTRHMDYVQLSMYLVYTILMTWWVFFRKRNRTS